MVLANLVPDLFPPSHHNPFGVASLRRAVCSLWSFGRALVPELDAGGRAKVVWVVRAGWWLALTHLAVGVALPHHIGIPFAVADFTLVAAGF
ncbi:YccF domain-containing protein [Micromonospora sp. B11E3]|uniref:YccF domain-containing protein n=1 Tax=Micromonospora sp. B11E3 TaxID=3153562 RepID=UPI00325F5EA1